MTSLADPHEAGPRAATFAKDENDERFLRALNAHLRALPVPSREPLARAATLPIVYIVGVPRSGTTLLSQLLSKHLEIGYIDNLIARFWARPSVGIRLSQLCLGPAARRSILLQSTHGTTPGVAGPHEFGYFWREWLRLDEASTHHLTDAELERVDAAGLRRALVEEILAEFGLPAVFKNVICGFHARFLTQIHPRTLFVHVTRDPVAAASSILQTRKARYGSYDAWWSLKPRAFDTICQARSPAEAVALQVFHCRREFDSELSRGGVRTISIPYESLCRDPEQEVHRVQEAVEAIGCDIRSSSVPFAPLAISEGPQLPADLRQPLEAFFGARQRPS
jgi:LPS sulfotransferase NodH